MTTCAKDRVFFNKFYTRVRERPDAVFLTQPEGGGRIRDFTFAQVLDEAKRMAAHLRSLELPPGSQIAIVSKNCAHFILSDLAIWMAGHVSVAIYPTMNAEELRYILEDCEARVLFVGKLDAPAWERMKDGVPAGLPCIAYPLAPPTDLPRWDDLIARHDPIAGEPEREPDDRAIIIYTSGSSGRPKGVVHTFAAVSIADDTITNLAGTTTTVRWLSFLPLAHSFERWAGETQALSMGFRIYFAESIETFVEDLKRARPTHIAVVPRILAKLQAGVFAKIPERRLSILMRIPIIGGIVRKKILVNLGLDALVFGASGSAPLSVELLTWFQRLGLHFGEGYGMTENFNLSHLGMPGRNRPGHVGPPYEGVTCRISDEGEILVKSPSNMLGYHRMPEATKAAFTEDGFLRTGDRGEISPEGYLRITGRLKDIFKTDRGKYVAPEPIEQLLAGGSVESACVAGAGRPAAHAILQLTDEAHLRREDPEARAEMTRTLQGLLDRVNRDLATHERLAFAVVAKDRWTPESGLITPTLKLKRQALEKKYEAQLEGWYTSGKTVIWE